MSEINRKIIAGNDPLFLTESEINQPSIVVMDFIKTYSLEDCRTILNFCLFHLFTRTDADPENMDREVIWCFLKDVERLIEANFIYDANWQLSGVYKRLKKHL